MMLHDDLYDLVVRISLYSMAGEACVAFIMAFAGAVSRKLSKTKFYTWCMYIIGACGGISLLVAITGMLELIAEGVGLANLFLIIVLAACAITELTYDDREEVAKARGPERPPEFALRHWFRSPDNIETQKFEGGYDGSLNREFERKKPVIISAEERQEQEQKPNAAPSDHEDWMDLWS